MKKILSALCAIGLLMGSLASSPAGADLTDAGFWKFTLEEGESGKALMNTTLHPLGFIVVTDGTPLEEFKAKRYEDIGVTKIPATNEYFLSTWDEQSREALSAYGTDVLYYEVTMRDTTGDTRERLPEIGRDFMRTHEGVKGIFIYEINVSFDAKWDGRFEAFGSEESVHSEEYRLHKEDLEDPEGFTNTLLDGAKAQYQIWNEQIEAWEKTVNIADMTDEEIFLARQEAGLPSDYDMMAYAFDISRTWQERYPTVLEIAQPTFTTEQRTGFATNTWAWDDTSLMLDAVPNVVSTVSASDFAGDINADGATDIMDVILLNKAIFGQTTFTEEQTQAADINHDGTVDSTDALIMMKYIIGLESSLG